MPRSLYGRAGAACERAQWLRGDPESRKTFGEEERRRSGFRRFAKRNTEKAECAATKRTGYGAGAGDSRREQRARRPLRQEYLAPAAPPTRGLGVGRGARGVRIVPFFTAGSRPRPTVAFPVRYVARRCDLSWEIASLRGGSRCPVERPQFRLARIVRNSFSTALLCVSP